MNEFYDYNDQIGLFNQEVEPYKYLTIEARTQKQSAKVDPDAKATYAMMFKLADKFNTRER